ncbi:integrase catalytic domain-containing protein [Trichonephila clavipes]|nr:integrase catalytic domain-containing protein [Trichonephila clavipes]
MTSEASWHHVKSQENPADCASRGIAAASKLKVHKLRWFGPQRLSQDSLHFPSIDLSTSCEEDVKSWCKRFIENCRSSTVTGVLTSKEVDDATKTVIQTVQESQFNYEIQLLKKKHPLPNISKLLPLVDLNFPYYSFGQKFWIPSGRGIVGRLLSKCQTCFRFKVNSGEQLMGNFPANRFSAGRACLNVGIDFGGPFITKLNVFRSKVKLKSYLALFICMTTKAGLLEVVSDLSPDAFLAALRCFISRRGKPNNMSSYNAANFQVASSYLKKQLKLIKSVEVQNFVTQESITCHFIPPKAGHVGGLWETGIKST